MFFRLDDILFDDYTQIVPILLEKEKLEEIEKSLKLCLGIRS